MKRICCTRTYISNKITFSSSTVTYLELELNKMKLIVCGHILSVCCLTPMPELGIFLFTSHKSLMSRPHLFLWNDIILDFNS